jgi:hypothetical protein
MNRGITQLKSFVVENGNIPSGVTWFLVALLYLKFLMDAVKIRPILTGILYCMSFCLLMLLKVKTCYITNALMVFPFYFTGAQFKDHIEKIIFRRGSIVYAFICLFLIIGIVLINGRTSTRGIGFGTSPIPINIFLFYSAGLIGTLMVLFVSTKFKANKIITYIATSLITILGMQAIFNDPYRKLLPEENYVMMIIISVVILLACTGIHWLIMKYCPILLGKIKEKK